MAGHVHARAAIHAVQPAAFEEHLPGIGRPVYIALDDVGRTGGDNRLIHAAGDQGDRRPVAVRRLAQRLSAA